VLSVTSGSREGCFLPAHLERVEHVLDLADKGCPCCGRQMHRIGEDRTERLDVVPAQLRVRLTIRPRYACRGCTDEGGGEDWAIAATLIRTAILNGVDPQAWLTDVLEQMVIGKVNSRSLASLLPWAWRDAKRAELAA